MFVERGPDNVSLRDVAQAAGVNHGLIHHYIGSRQELLDQVFAASTRDAFELIGDAPDLATAVERLRSISDEGWVRLLAWTILAGNPPDPAAEGGSAIDAVLAMADGSHDIDRLRMDLATIMLHGLAMNLFGDWVREAVGLTDTTADEFREQMNARVETSLDPDRENS